MHEAVRLKRFTDTIPAENYSVVKEMPFAFDDGLLQVPPYLLYLSGVFEVKLKSVQFAHPLSEPSNATRFLDSVNTLAYTSLPGKSAEYFIAQSLYARARSQPIERTRSEFNTFNKKWPASEYMTLLQKQVALAEKMAPGQPAPDIDIILQSGNKVKLSDLKGKVVYLSFWSMQCRQCVGEMRGDKKVKEVFKSKPVEFVYVSIDEDSAAARKLIAQLGIEGGFTWTTGGWYSSEAQQYGVQGMPAHFLIDRDGNFAMQNPPGPAQKTELIVAISKLY
jgi:peroxiredoxin